MCKYTCQGVCARVRSVQQESCSIPFCLVPLGQDTSLYLELGWQVENPTNPSVLNQHKLLGAYGHGHGWLVYKVLGYPLSGLRVHRASALTHTSQVPLTFSSQMFLFLAVNKSSSQKHIPFFLFSMVGAFAQPYKHVPVHCGAKMWKG